MKIVRDEPKRLANLETHQLDFIDAEYFDWETAIVRPSHSGQYRVIGSLDGETICLIVKPLGTEALSIISMRRANRKERKLR